MKWYIPSWNGDLRLVSDDDNPDRTVMLIEKPTVGEQQIVNQIGEQCLRMGYLKSWEKLVPRTGWFARKKWRFVIDAPMRLVGPMAAAIMRPGPAVLTAIRFSDGECIISTGGQDELMPALSPYREPAALPPAPPKEQEPEKAAVAAAPAPAPAPAPAAPKVAAPTVAATVPRPTPCCPDCVPGAIEPATECLLAFLTPEQHEQWANHRFVTVDGNLTGHRYLIAHRNTRRAARQGRICVDLDDGCVMHFHDWTLPPEEEVLAAMLILGNREHWLRNEATCFGGRDVYKNPFGDGGDGVWDSQLTQQIGGALLGRTDQRTRRTPLTIRRFRRSDP